MIIIKTAVLIFISIFITINTSAMFRDYFKFQHKVNSQDFRNRKLGYSNKLNIYHPNLKNLFDILSKKIIVNPFQINNITIHLNHILKKQNKDYLEQDAKNLDLNFSDINKIFIVPSFGTNPKYLAKFLNSIASKNIINKKLIIKQNYKFIFIENFFKYIKKNNLQTFIAIAILKILNPKNIFIVQNPLKMEIINNKIEKIDLSSFIKYKKLYRKIEYKKMNLHNPKIIKMEIQNFYTYKHIYLNEKEKTRFIITQNLNKTIKEMANIIRLFNNKTVCSISYNKSNSPRNISLNKKINNLLQTKKLKLKKSIFKKCITNKIKIRKRFIYQIAPTTLDFIKKNIFCIYKIDLNLEIETIRI